MICQSRANRKVSVETKMRKLRGSTDNTIRNGWNLTTVLLSLFMEEWKDIENSDSYMISNIGNVKRKQHQRWNYLNKSYSTYKERVIKPSYTNQKKYARVQIFYNGVKKIESVHRLVALTFIKNPYKLPQVNHKDGNKKNNTVSNLEWCSNDYNMMHRYKTFDSSVKGESSNFAKLTEQQVIEIAERLKKGESGKSLSLKYNVSPSTISELKNGRSWNHLKLFPKRLKKSQIETRKRWSKIKR